MDDESLSETGRPAPTRTTGRNNNGSRMEGEETLGDADILAMLQVGEQGEIQALMDNINRQVVAPERILACWVNHWTTRPPGVSYRDWALGMLNCVADGEPELPENHDQLIEAGEKIMHQVFKLEFLLQTQSLLGLTDTNRDVLARGYCSFKMAFEHIEREVLAANVFDEHRF